MFDIIGDVHGCFEELYDLLNVLNQKRGTSKRQLIFVGDLIDRGPSSPEVVETVYRYHKLGYALAVQGNHDDKLIRYVKGNPVKVSPGLQTTLDQYKPLPLSMLEVHAEFLASLPYQLSLDDDKLRVAHAAICDRPKRSYNIYGPNAKGQRLPWVQDYKGPLAVFGHEVVPEVTFINNTVDVDTGCVFGGKLSALRYPEMEVVSVPARKEYWSYHANPDRPTI